MASSSNEARKDTTITITRTDTSESNPSLKSPRTPRFAEATSVISPIDPPDTAKLPATARSTQFLQPVAQPADVGFGYIQNEKHTSQSRSVEVPFTPASPLKSAMRTPGAPPKSAMFSPTWDEEAMLEKQEALTEVEQAKDVRVKARVRIAKMALRFTNFSCSLIVLSMLATTFQIVNATRSLPPRNDLPPWASNTKAWPAILLLCIACISLLAALAVFYGYWRGGHKRAEKAAARYSVFAVCFFVFSIIMWGVGAAILQHAKNTSNGDDIWGWSCKNNARKDIFENQVHYDLVCRLQNWSLVCALIEIVVEVITIMIYGVVFYRFYSKRRLHKSMMKRDEARSDLYLSQLRSQSASAPVTPGIYSPRDGGYNPAFSPRYAGAADSKDGVHASIDEVTAVDEDQRYITYPVNKDRTAQVASVPFKLSTPPKKGTPKLDKDSFSPISDMTESPQSSTLETAMPAKWVNSPVELRDLGTNGPKSPAPVARKQEHAPAAPGEETYEDVPIPGAYIGAINSPTHPPQTPAPFGSLH